MKYGILYVYVPESYDYVSKKQVLEDAVKSSKEFFNKADYIVLTIAVHDPSQVRFQII